MILSSGSRLGPYEIIARIGSGGMGEVFHARDTRLDRSVAVKVLPPDLARDADLKMRFEREAKMISQLSHPHICTLFDVGHANGNEYLVMELLEGETLADALARGPLPVEDVLTYGIQICGALEKAHREGIVHRDLKPANVMLTKSGAKLLDFGLAKPAAKLASWARPTTGTRHRERLTQQGFIVGTYGYMSPEQLRGADATPRTDIFALGALLYEMASGNPAFEGFTAATLVNATTSTEPEPLSVKLPAIPPALEHVIERCLEKDPDERWHSAHDIAAELRWIQRSAARTTVTPAPAIAEPPKPAKRFTWALPLATAIAAVAATWGLIEWRREPAPLVTSSIVTPANVQYQFRSGAPVLSPDGTRLVFPARIDRGTRMLWLRRLSGGAAQPVDGTEDASHPFWSPDGRFIAFFANGKLKKVRADGGPVQTLCDVESGRGGTWSQHGSIVYAPSSNSGLMIVPAEGGAPRAATTLDPKSSERSHRYPHFLPDGEHFLYFVDKFSRGATTIGVASIDGRTRKEVTAASSNAIYAAGHLLFMRDGTLVAQAFDAGGLTASPEVTPIADSVSVSERSEGTFSATRDGVLAYWGGAHTGYSELKWLGPDGKELGTVGKPADYVTPAISHDGRKVAVGIRNERQFDIWVLDLARGTSARLTFDDKDELHPRWSPDDQRILYTSTRNGPGDVMMKRVSGGSAEETVYATSDDKVAHDWSGDGRFLAIQELNAKRNTDWDISIYSVADRKSVPFVQTRFLEQSPSFSPDGRWLSYTSSESGQPQIYVQAVGGDGKWQVSTEGGVKSSWSADGRRLYYVHSSALYAVDVTTAGDELDAGPPRVVAELPRLKSHSGLQYAVAADGRILVNSLVSTSRNDRHTEPITLVQNWPRLLGAR
jgi:eukaryotic-like serine/threonine-protein kinase